ncbi:hypothetical protein L210DRAFT_3638347 [Boletus edulis BED1]|uniref:Uncharacterized protein n=1 Tax=Boletus edulis BED1 TaxID=1328754 RepID=A0AAD4G493_BOLED|nr:hypothetical protein L210DRAFT_3638347 [Boletus edulis BED1]
MKPRSPRRRRRPWRIRRIVLCRAREVQEDLRLSTRPRLEFERLFVWERRVNTPLAANVVQLIPADRVCGMEGCVCTSTNNRI